MTELDRVLEGIERVDTRVETLSRQTGEFQLDVVQRMTRVEEQTKSAVSIAKDAQKSARKAATIVSTAVAATISAVSGAFSFIRGGD